MISQRFGAIVYNPFDLWVPTGISYSLNILRVKIFDWLIDEFRFHHSNKPFFHGGVNNTKHIQEQQLLTNYLINYIHYKQKYKIQLPQKQPRTVTIKYNTSNVQKQTNNQVYNK